MVEPDKDPLSSLLRKNASVVVKDESSSRGLVPAEMLAWRHWFDQHRHKLSSSGGRPTNPAWKIKRQISFSPEVWQCLEKRAAACSEAGQTIGPGQVAGFLIEDAVREKLRVSGAFKETDVDEELEEISSDARFHDWTMPSLFSGAAS